MKQETGRVIKLDVMLSTTDQRDFISFYSFEKNPHQKFLFLAALFAGFIIILLRDTAFPAWISFTIGIFMIVLLFFIWRQRARVSRMAQGPWIVKNRLTLVTLDENGIVEIDPGASEDEDEYEYDADEDDEDYNENGDAEVQDGDAKVQDGDAKVQDGDAVTKVTDDVSAFAKGQEVREGAAAEAGDSPSGKIVRSGKWRDFSGAYENNRYFYVFLGDVEAFILQKTRMRESLVPEVRAFIAEKMGERFRTVK